MALEDLQPQAGPARALHRRLRAAEDHFALHHRQVFGSRDGCLYLVRAAMGPDVIEEDPYPDVSGPRRLHEPPDDQLDRANDIALRRLEADLDPYFIETLRDSAGQHVLTRANRIGFRRVHDLQVVWLGKLRVWLVLQGGIRWKEYDSFTGAYTVKKVIFPNTPVRGQSGWIILPVRVSVENYDSRDDHVSSAVGYRLTPGAPAITGAPFNTPPRSSITSPEIDPGVYASVQTWSSGTFNLPIAYVTVPDAARHQPPLIDQVAEGSWDVSSLDLGHWPGTWPQSTFRSKLT